MACNIIRNSRHGCSDWKGEEDSKCNDKTQHVDVELECAHALLQLSYTQVAMDHQEAEAEVTPTLEATAATPSHKDSESII